MRAPPVIMGRSTSSCTVRMSRRICAYYCEVFCQCSIIKRDDGAMHGGQVLEVVLRGARLGWALDLAQTYSRSFLVPWVCQVS